MSIDQKNESDFPQIKYAVGEEPFFRDMRSRVNAYFKENNITRYATPLMVGKAVVQFFMLIGFYALIISNNYQGWPLFFLHIAFYFTVFLVSVGIAHDGSHNAYSSKAYINRVLNSVFDFIGINSYMWEFNHIKSHHNMPNIPLYDSAIDSFTFFRFHPRAEYYKFHKYQHLYIFGIYAFATIFKIFFLDFISFRRKRIGFIEIEKHSWIDLIWLCFTKLVVLSYTLILPLVLLDAPAWQILLGFLCGNFVAGLALGAIFQVTHVSDHSTWPEPDQNGIINNSFARHILETTSDFCPYNKMVTWISGGLNNHVAHHLFPGISQIHLPALTKIVKQTANDYNVSYKEYPTVWSALSSHCVTLRKLGNPDQTQIILG